jgi:prepilin-type N-terminal cleavage/methylation domain-containing protein
MCRSTNSAGRQGFTLLETLVALVVLAVGVLAMGSLAGRCLSTSRQSKFVSLAGELASEKLEDLNRWNVESPQVCVPLGVASVGSLTSDVLQTTTCPPPLSQCSATSGKSDTVNYYDDVAISTVVTGSNSPCPNTTYGCFSEVVSGIQSGATVYSTTVHPPSGQIQTLAPPSSTPPTLVTFHRRWVIEGNTPVPGDSAICLSGTRRVTVLVTLQDTSVKPGVTFQMSTVRP